MYVRSGQWVSEADKKLLKRTVWSWNLDFHLKVGLRSGRETFIYIKKTGSQNRTKKYLSGQINTTLHYLLLWSSDSELSHLILVFLKFYEHFIQIYGLWICNEVTASFFGFMMNILLFDKVQTSMDILSKVNDIYVFVHDCDCQVRCPLPWPPEIYWIPIGLWLDKTKHSNTADRQRAKILAEGAR